MAHVTEEDKKQHRSRKSSDKSDKVVTSSFNLGGLLGGLGGFIEKLGELAEAGETLSKSGEFGDAGGKFHGVYGINVKTALGDSGQTELKVEPFGNVRRGAAERPAGEDVREPLVDVYEEDSHVLVLVELPGVVKESIKLEVSDGRLLLSAERGKTTYRKEVELPESCSADKMNWECSNGILQVRFDR